MFAPPPEANRNYVPPACSPSPAVAVRLLGGGLLTPAAIGNMWWLNTDPAIANFKTGGHALLPSSQADQKLHAEVAGHALRWFLC